MTQTQIFQLLNPNPNPNNNIKINPKHKLKHKLKSILTMPYHALRNNTLPLMAIVLNVVDIRLLILMIKVDVQSQFAIIMRSF